jgi:DNA-binding response OmpR family regulator
MKKTIIHILDHNSTQGAFLKYQLAMTGFKDIQHFHSPDECLYSLEKERIPDFIIVDPDFTGMNIENFLHKVNQLNSEVKVIVFSKRDDAEFAAVLLRSGAIDYIVRNGNDLMSIRELTSNLQFIIKEEKFSE